MFSQRRLTKEYSKLAYTYVFIDRLRKTIHRDLSVSRPKTQCMGFTFEQNKQGNQEPVKILLGEELESVTHFKSTGRSIEEEGVMETEIPKRVGAGRRNWKKFSGVLWTSGCQ